MSRQSRQGSARASHRGQRGRGAAPEKVTWGASRAALRSPIPPTRVSAVKDPKAPWRSRSRMIRCANAGPIPGNVTSTDSGAVSRSTRATVGRLRTGDEGEEGEEGEDEGDGEDEGAGRRPRRPRVAIALSTAASCPANASRALGVGAGARPRTIRTPVPRLRTTARKTSA